MQQAVQQPVNRPLTPRGTQNTTQSPSILKPTVNTPISNTSGRSSTFNTQNRSTRESRTSTPSVNSPKINQSTPYSNQQQSRSTTNQSTLLPKDLFGNSPSSMPSPITPVDPGKLPLLYWNGFRVLAGRTLISWLRRSTLVPLENDPGMDKAAIRARSIYEFCDIGKQLANEGERVIIGFGEELVLNNNYQPDKFGVVMIDLVDWLIDKNKVQQLILFTIPPDLNRMRNGSYMSCLKQISGKIWAARKDKPQDLYNSITVSVAFQLPDRRNLTDRDWKIIEAKPKLFNEDECKLLDNEFASFIIKVADVKLGYTSVTPPTSILRQSERPNTGATSGSSSAFDTSVKSTSDGSETQNTGINRVYENPDNFDSEMGNLISENQGVCIEDDPDDDLNVKFFATDPYTTDEDSEGYEDWHPSSVMDEEAYENMLCRDPNNYFIDAEGRSGYQFIDDQIQSKEQFYNASDCTSQLQSTEDQGNELQQ